MPNFHAFRAYGNILGCAYGISKAPLLDLLAPALDEARAHARASDRASTQAQNNACKCIVQRFASFSDYEATLGGQKSARGQKKHVSKHKFFIHNTVRSAEIYCCMFLATYEISGSNVD